MKMSELFTKKVQLPGQSEDIQPIVPKMTLDLEALDDCVGGRAETDGVGCYAHSTQPNVH